MRSNAKTRTLFAAVMAATLAAQNALGCTGIMLTASDGSFVHGRTVEFGATIDSSIAVVPRGQALVGKTPRGEGLKYKAKYAAVGAVAFTDAKLLDGLNEQGLAVGAFYFPGFAAYTPVTEANQTKGLSPGDFPNWLLTQFLSVGEVRSAIERGDAIITPAIIDHWGSEAPPLHYVV